MRIVGPGGTGRPTTARSSKPSRQEGQFRLAQSDAGGRSTAASGPRPLASIDSLLTVQQTPDAGERRRKAVKRGHDLLDLLDDMKLDLLAGQPDHARLTRLARIIREQRETVESGELSGVLDEIELRAAVELAKRERAAA